MPRRSAMSRPIDDVHLVAFLEQIRSPTGTAVGCAHPVEALATAAVHEHNRKRPRHARWDPILDVHLLSVGARAAGELRLLDSNPEVAPLREVKRSGRRFFGGPGVGPRQPTRPRHSSNGEAGRPGPQVAPADSNHRGSTPSERKSSLPTDTSGKGMHISVTA